MYAHEIGFISIKVSEVHTLALVRRFSWHFYNSSAFSLSLIW